MNYMPSVKSWNMVGSAPLGPSHTVKVFDTIRAAGSIQYAYLVGVFDNASDEPVYFVASEVNSVRRCKESLKPPEGASVLSPGRACPPRDV